jgi:hypothetical protein
VKQFGFLLVWDAVFPVFMEVKMGLWYNFAIFASAFLNDHLVLDMKRRKFYQRNK